MRAKKARMMDAYSANRLRTAGSRKHVTDDNTSIPPQTFCEPSLTAAAQKREPSINSTTYYFLPGCNIHNLFLCRVAEDDN
jgi:hypothetical protein